MLCKLAFIKIYIYNFVPRVLIRRKFFLLFLWIWIGMCRMFHYSSKSSEIGIPKPFWWFFKLGDSCLAQFCLLFLNWISAQWSNSWQMEVNVELLLIMRAETQRLATCILAGHWKSDNFLLHGLNSAAKLWRCSAQLMASWWHS